MKTAQQEYPQVYAALVEANNALHEMIEHKDFACAVVLAALQNAKDGKTEDEIQMIADRFVNIALEVTCLLMVLRGELEVSCLEKDILRFKKAEVAIVAQAAPPAAPALPPSPGAGEIVKSKRKALNWTQAKLAKDAGTSGSALSNFENHGCFLHRDVVNNISDLLGLSQAERAMLVARSHDYKKPEPAPEPVIVESPPLVEQPAPIKQRMPMGYNSPEYAEKLAEVK